MFSCLLCEKETVLTTRLCDKCRRIKHLLNLYENRVYEVLENVLVRNEEDQKLKESQEISKDIEKKKEYNSKNQQNINKMK
jgi:glutaredoxin